MTDISLASQGASQATSELPDIDAQRASRRKRSRKQVRAALMSLAQEAAIQLKQWQGNRNSRRLAKCSSASSSSSCDTVGELQLSAPSSRKRKSESHVGTVGKRACDTPSSDALSRRGCDAAATSPLEELLCEEDNFDCMDEPLRVPSCSVSIVCTAAPLKGVKIILQLVNLTQG